MNKEEIRKAVQKARESANGRNFTQTLDLVVNLQNLDLRKPDHKLDLGVTLESQIKPKKLVICAVVDHSMNGVEEVFDKVMYQEDLNALKGDVEGIRRLAKSYDRFVVQSNLMPTFAQILGRYLGPLNKMPSPKLGMVITERTNVSDLYERLQKTVHIQTKKNQVLQLPVGSEAEDEETLVNNIQAVHEALLQNLPTQQNNIKNMGVKLTMGKLAEV